MTAAVATHTQEAMGEHAAIQVRAQLPFDEVGNGRVAFACTRQEGFDLFADDLVEKRLFGLSAFVLGHAKPARDQGGRLRCQGYLALPTPKLI